MPSSRPTAFPFLRIAEGRVEASRWFHAGEPPQPVTDELHGWDYELPVDVFRRVRIPELEACFEDLGIDPEDELLALTVTASISTPRTRSTWRKVEFKQTLPSSGVADLSPRITLDSKRLAGTLALSTDIILTRRPAAASTRLSPQDPGSRLWEDHHAVALEGTLARLPMDDADFTAVASYKQVQNAKWIIDWDPAEFELHTSAALRVVLNSHFPGVLAALQEGDPALLSALRVDLARQLIRTLAGSDDYRDSLPLLEDGSLGAVARNWMQLAFPGMDCLSIHQLAIHHPGRFEAVIESTFSLAEANR